MIQSLNACVLGDGPPLVLLHGFTGSSGAWGEISKRLARRRRVIAFDLPGHGRSPAPNRPADARLPELASALARELDAIGVRDAHWVGYSLGGRVALHLAVAYPERVRALVLEGTSPGIDDPRERRARRVADAALADAIERDGLARFVDAWLAQPLFATQARLPADVRRRERERRLRGSAAGFAAALRAMGVGEQQPLWERLPDVRRPVLVVAGDEDVKYRALALAMAQRLPDARVAIVTGAGHAVHLERPEAWLEVVESFLDQVGDGQLAGTA